MKQLIYLGLLLIGLLLTGCVSQYPCPKNIETEGIIAAEAVLQEISTEFIFTEGPAADRFGNVYFTDQPNDRIMVYTTDGKMETFMQPSGRSNGLYFDQDGQLLSCADENTELWRIDVDTKQHVILTGTYRGKLFNGPNDVWEAPNGDLYFTDPFYKRDWWAHDAQPQNIRGVYLLKYNYPRSILGQEPERVVDDLDTPNGIIGTPDGKTLYVADIDGHLTYAYEIRPDGTLSGKRLFCEMGSDGMTIDCCGNVYLTNEKGVTVFNPSGKQIEQIKTPQGWTANVTFGGKDRNMLFITALNGVYTLQMNVQGVK